MNCKLPCNFFSTCKRAECTRALINIYDDPGNRLRRVAFKKSKASMIIHRGTKTFFRLIRKSINKNKQNTQHAVFANAIQKSRNNGRTAPDTSVVNHVNAMICAARNGLHVNMTANTDRRLLLKLAGWWKGVKFNTLSLWKQIVIWGSLR